MSGAKRNLENLRWVGVAVAAFGAVLMLFPLVCLINGFQLIYSHARMCMHWFNESVLLGISAVMILAGFGLIALVNKAGQSDEHNEGSHE